MIGMIYHYPNSKRMFKLVEVNEWVYIFECGHRVTDNVFTDLIRINQLKLF